MMLQAVFSKDVAARLMRIYKKLRPYLHEPVAKRQWEDCVYYAMSSAKHFTRQECETIFTEIRNTGDTIMSTTDFVSVADQFRAEGKTEGIAIGEAKVASAKAETVLTFLRAKFRRVPKGIEKAVRQMTDPIALDSLAVQAAQSQTLNEFEKAIG